MSSDQKRESPSFTFLVVTSISAIAAGNVAKGYLAPSAAMGVNCCFIGMAFVAWVRWDLRSKWRFVLERLLRTAQPGELGCAMSFGPGLTAETMLFHAAAKPASAGQAAASHAA